MSALENVKRTFAEISKDDDATQDGVANLPPYQIRAIMATLQVRATIAVAEEISLLRQAIIDKPNSAESKDARRAQSASELRRLPGF